MRIRLLATLLAVCLASCTVGPDYQRPTVVSPDAWRMDYPKATDVANTKWWEQFGDPVLNELVETALRENLDIQIAAARVDQFIGALTSSRRSATVPMPAGYGRAPSASHRCHRVQIPIFRSTRARLVHPGSSTSLGASGA